MRTKLFKTGGSSAVTLPASVLKSKEWNNGDELEVQEMPSGVLIRSVPRKSFLAEGRRVMRVHDRMLRALAKR